MGLRRERVEEKALQALEDSRGCVDPRRVAELKEARRGERLALVVGRDLKIPGCGAVFGYAEKKRGVAVVSTFRLGGEAEKLGERVEKVLAHEAGHLEGRGHCREPRCAMHQAKTVEDLDRRGLELCERCAKGGWQKKHAAVAAAAAVLALFFGLDASVKALTKRTLPFTAQEDAVLFRKAEVLQTTDGEQARRAAAALNAAYMKLEPPPLVMKGRKVETGGVVVAEFGGEEAARAWIEVMEPLLRGKGAREDGCPDCHMDRHSEVDESARRRARAWR